MDTSNSHRAKIGISLYYSKPEAWEKTIPLHPYHLKLTEALSAGGRGELTVFCEQSVTAEKLAQLTGCKAEVQIHHTCESPELTHDADRFFAGFITAVKHCGLYFSSGSMKIYRFVLLIESPDVMLTYALRSAQYEQTAVELVKTLYIQNKLDGADVVAAPNLSSDFKLDKVKFVFDQRAEKDYDFLRRSLAALGLSYVFQYVPPQNGQPVLPKLMLCCGSNYPTESESGEKETTFSCLSSDTVFRMDSWSMTSRQGVKGVRINYQPSDSKATNSFAGEENDAKLYDLHEFPLDLAEDQPLLKDENIFAKNYLNSFNMNDSDWVGACMMVDGTQPGNKILLQDFYGDDTVIKARVVSSVLDCCSSVDIDIQNDDLKAPEVSVTVHCRSIEQAITTPAAKSLAAPAGKVPENTPPMESSGSEEPSLASSGIAGVGNTGTETGVQSNVSIIPAIVCEYDKSKSVAKIGNSGSGKTGSCATFLTSDNRETYNFQAYIGSNSVEGSAFAVTPNDIINVRLVMPLGGRGEGLFHVPRIGDRILVFRNGNENYLAGYLPNSENFKFLHSNRDKVNKGNIASSNYPVGDMTVLRQNSTDGSLDYLNDNTYQTLNHPKGRRKNAGDDNGRKVHHPFSEIGIYGPIKEDGSLKKSGLVNIASAYDLNVSARKEVYIEGRNIEIACPGYKDTYNDKGTTNHGIVKIQEVGEVMVEAEHGITLKCGNSFIAITPGGIVIQSAPKTSFSGPVGATIALDPFTGICISGSRFVGIGNLGVSLIASPSSVSIGASGVSLSGPSVTSSTVLKLTALMTSVLTAEGMLKQAASLTKEQRKTATNTWDSIWSKFGLFSDAVMHQAEAIRKLYYQSKNKRPWGDIGEVIFELLFLIGHIVVAGVKAGATQKWLNEHTPKDSSPTREQYLSLAAFLFILTKWLVILGIFAMKRKANKTAIFQLKDEEIYQSSKLQTTVSNEEVNVNTVSPANAKTVSPVDGGALQIGLGGVVMVGGGIETLAAGFAGGEDSEEENKDAERF